MKRRLQFLCVTLLALAASARAQSPEDLRGTWVAQTEGRNLIVLKLDGTPTELVGTLQRPMGGTYGMATAAGTRVSQIRTPVYTVQLKESRTTPAGRLLALQNQSGAAVEFLIRPEGSNRLRLGFAPNAPDRSLLPLTRASNDATVASDWDQNRTYLIAAPVQQPNAELAALYAADQADRQGARGAIDWSVVGPRDESRRLRVRQLLEAGQLRAADDYYGAAFVFQHGSKPEDHLLAHVLAMAAMTLGRDDASWIAAATLDRYLQNTERAQIFGTQYVGRAIDEMTQGNYDRVLIPDSLRQVLGVPTQEQQQAQLKQMNAPR